MLIITDYFLYHIPEGEECEPTSDTNSLCLAATGGLCGLLNPDDAQKGGGGPWEGPCGGFNGCITKCALGLLIPGVSGLYGSGT